MGVVNVTPDSFSDGGRFFDPEAAVAHARLLVADGADLLDIGGESTRPGAVSVSAEEELARVLPVIERVRAALPNVPISLDTTKAVVACAGVGAGASLVNDISGGTLDPDMLPAVAALGVPVCLMHLPVRPEAMGWSQAGGTLEPEADAVAHVVEFLRRQVRLAEEAGIARENVLIDPGFGFGKTPEQNLDLLRRMGEIQAALGGLPLLFGPSRKSTIARVLGKEAERADPDRVAGTAALVALAAAYGADVVRVHDAAFMARVTRMADAVARRPLPRPV
jgi:dihydropteroate synthase